jgi:hypothetical protein
MQASDALPTNITACHACSLIYFIGAPPIINQQQSKGLQSPGGMVDLIVVAVNAL